MTDQSELPQQGKNLLRKQALRWPGLVKKWGFADGSHLKQSGFPRILKELPPPAREIGRGGGGGFWRSSPSHSTPEQHGTAEAASTKPQKSVDTRVRATVSLAAERLTWWAMDLFEDWSSGVGPNSDNFIEQLKRISATVESEVMGLWDGTEPRAEIFEPECRSEVKEILLKISEEFSDKARNAELSCLDATSRSARSQAMLARVPAQRIPPATETQNTVPIELVLKEEEPDSCGPDLLNPELPEPDDLPGPDSPQPVRRGYRAEIEAFQQGNPKYGTNPKLARYLGIDETVLKSIKSNKGRLRCNQETLLNVLRLMGISPHE